LKPGDIESFRFPPARGWLSSADAGSSKKAIEIPGTATWLSSLSPVSHFVHVAAFVSDGAADPIAVAPVDGGLVVAGGNAVGGIGEGGHGASAGRRRYQFAGGLSSFGAMALRRAAPVALPASFSDSIMS
jgi:hypothetical protein